mgnify:CR=1 FL=1
MNAELTFLNALQALRTPALDGVMRFFTHLGDSGFVWLALTALLLAFRRTRRAGWVLAAALLFDAVLCNILLKPMVGRIRPCDILTEAELLIPRPEDFSFPSGHTLSSTIAATTPASIIVEIAAMQDVHMNVIVAALRFGPLDDAFREGRQCLERL